MRGRVAHLLVWCMPIGMAQQIPGEPEGCPLAPTAFLSRAVWERLGPANRGEKGIRGGHPHSPRFVAQTPIGQIVNLAYNYIT